MIFSKTRAFPQVSNHETQCHVFFLQFNHLSNILKSPVPIINIHQSCFFGAMVDSGLSWHLIKTEPPPHDALSKLQPESDVWSGIRWFCMILLYFVHSQVVLNFSDFPIWSKLAANWHFTVLLCLTWKTSRHCFPWGFDQYDKGQEMFAFLRHLMRSGSALVKPLLLGRNEMLLYDGYCWWTKCCTSWNTWDWLKEWDNMGFLCMDNYTYQVVQDSSIRNSGFLWALRGSRC